MNLCNVGSRCPRAHHPSTGQKSTTAWCTLRTCAYRPSGCLYFFVLRQEKVRMCEQHTRLRGLERSSPAGHRARVHRPSPLDLVTPFVLGQGRLGAHDQPAAQRTSRDQTRSVESKLQSRESSIQARLLTTRRTCAGRHSSCRCVFACAPPGWIAWYDSCHYGAQTQRGGEVSKMYGSARPIA